jgi:hypothetical protein
MSLLLSFFLNMYIHTSMCLCTHVSWYRDIHMPYMFYPALRNRRKQMPRACMSCYPYMYMHTRFILPWEIVLPQMSHVCMQRLHIHVEAYMFCPAMGNSPTQMSHACMQRLHIHVEAYMFCPAMGNSPTQMSHVCMQRLHIHVNAYMFCPAMGNSHVQKMAGNGHIYKTNILYLINVNPWTLYFRAPEY